MVKPSTDHKHRILHVITSLETAGAQAMLYKLLSHMDSKNYKSEVVSLIDVGPMGRKIQELGIPVHGVGMRVGRPDPISIYRLIRIARKLRPNLIQGWLYHGNLAAQFAKVFLPDPAPVLWNIRHSIHNLDYEKKTTAWVIRLCAKLSNKPSRILYNSQVSADQHEALGYTPGKRVVIPNGFDTEFFSPSKEARLKIRKELGLPPSSIIIGLIGRYHVMKDHSNFIRAAAHLSNTHPDVHFLLAGKNVDVNNRELMDLILDLKLIHKFHLLGERKDMNILMAGLDMASSSSSFGEGFPNVIGEAMACEVPCVVTDIGDNAWVVGNTGHVIPPRDPVALAEAWKDLIDIGLEGRKEQGKKARDRIINKFFLSHIASQYESLYIQLLDTK
jgi:glycosyltransferase involved in cell wall biosynthesis